MPPQADLFAFAIASLLLALTPGPDLLYVIARGAAQGRHAGVTAAAGLCTGVIGHTLFCIVGLSPVIAASPAAFLILKAAGAAYLAYLAGRMWWGNPSFDSESDIEPAPLAAIFRQSVLMNLLNPKVALFFVAFLPQFVDPNAGSMAAQFAVLGAIFMTAGFLVMGPAGLGAGYLRKRFLGSPTTRRVFRIAAGMILLGLALRLMLDDLR